MKQILICKQCFYFPTKHEQEDHESILFLQNRIQWQCEVCSYQNIYHNNGEVGLPINNLLLLRRQNLVGNLLGQNESNYLFMIDCRNLKDKALYYPFHERKIVEEAINRKMNHLKTIQEMKIQSQWLTIFEDKCQAILKFATQRCRIERKPVRCLHEVVYLLQKYIKLIVYKSNSKNDAESFYIKVIDHDKVYHFQFTPSTIKNTTKITAFLLVLALIDCEYVLNIHKWLMNIYKSDLEKYCKFWTNNIKIKQMVVFSQQIMNILRSVMPQDLSQIEYSQLVEEQRIIYLTIDVKQEEKYVFSMHPLHERYLFQQNDANSSQSTQIMAHIKPSSQLFIFYSNKLHQIFRYVGSSKESQQVLQLLLNFRSNSPAEEHIFKLQLTKILKNRSIQSTNIVKICLQTEIREENRIILYTFDQKQYKQEPKQVYLTYQIINQSHLSANRFDDVQALTAQDFSPFFASYSQCKRIDCEILKISDEDYICL